MFVRYCVLPVFAFLLTACASPYKLGDDESGASIRFESARWENPGPRRGHIAFEILDRELVGDVGSGNRVGYCNASSDRHDACVIPASRNVQFQAIFLLAHGGMTERCEIPFRFFPKTDENYVLNVDVDAENHLCHLALYLNGNGGRIEVGRSIVRGGFSEGSVNGKTKIYTPIAKSINPQF